MATEGVAAILQTPLSEEEEGVGLIVIDGPCIA
jgi:hypothetical protein